MAKGLAKGISLKLRGGVRSAAEDVAAAADRHAKHTAAQVPDFERRLVE
jgi:hypothetical protein